MKNILYIGNKLNTAKANVSAIQTLGILLESEGYHLRYASSYNNKILRFIDMIWSCIKYSKWADAVLIDTYSTQNFYFALACSQICRLFKVPYIPILHGGNLPKRLLSHPKLCNSLFKHSHYNVSPSRYLLEKFDEMGYVNTMHIPNSIHIDDYNIQNKTFENIRLLWVRAFSEIYNPELAVSIMHKLKMLGYEAELCMVGPDADGSLERVKSKALALGVSVTFTGKLTKTEWVELSKNYNIFINTTNFDNMPVSVLEAMALGFPVVSTNVGGLPFLIDDKTNGLLVTPNEVEGFVEAIVTIYQNEDLRHKLSQNARIKAENFDWLSIKSQWNSILSTK